MTEKRAGAAAYFWWGLAGIAIWGDIFLKAYRAIYPALPNINGLLHAATLLLFAIGWGMRKRFATRIEPNGDFRFLLNKVVRFFLLIAILGVAVFAVACDQLFRSPQAVIFWDYVALGAFLVVILLGQMLLYSYRGMLRKYGTAL